MMASPQLDGLDKVQLLLTIRQALIHEKVDLTSEVYQSAEVSFGFYMWFIISYGCHILNI